MIRSSGNIRSRMKRGGISVAAKAQRAATYALALVLSISLTAPVMPVNAAWADEEQIAGNEQDAEHLQEGDQGGSSLSQLSEYYLTNDGFVTPVRLQNPWGSCWAFALTAALESSILKAERKLESEAAPGLALQSGADHTEPQLTGLNESIDLSERAIGWFAHQAQTEASSGSQQGEGNQRIDANDYKTQMVGGSFSIVETMLTAGQALVTEASAPYQYNGYSAGDLPWYSLSSDPSLDARARDWSLPETLRTENDTGWIITDTLRLSSPSTSQFVNDGSYYRYQGYNADATAKIKETLVDVGAVAVAIAADASLPQEVLNGRNDQAQPSEHLTFSTWAEYNASSEFIANHGVTIVGWDDSYSASNFAGTQSGQPPADGAWLCKNDWGSDALFESLGDAGSSMRWGIREEGSATGFFWLSYYDHTITEPVAFIVQPADQSYDSVYQYDYLGTSEFLVPVSYEQDLWVANVFTAQDTELLKAVSTQTFTENDSVHIRVYLISDAHSDGSPEAADAGSGDASADSGNIDAALGGAMADAGDADTSSSNADAGLDISVEILDDARLLYEAEQVFPTAGFHTVDLESPLLVTQGQRFVVMQSISTGGNAASRYLNLEAAFTYSPPDARLETYATVISNAGETYVNLSGSDDGWTSLEDFNLWYADVCAENDRPVDMLFGNALIKSYSDKTTMGKGGPQVYELVKMEAMSTLAS